MPNQTCKYCSGVISNSEKRRVWDLTYRQWFHPAKTEMGYSVLCETPPVKLSKEDTAELRALTMKVKTLLIGQGLGWKVSLIESRIFALYHVHGGITAIRDMSAFLDWVDAHSDKYEDAGLKMKIVTVAHDLNGSADSRMAPRTEGYAGKNG